MKPRLLSALTLAVFFLGAIVFAHDEFRIVGTISKRVDNTLTVKTQEGEIASMTISKNTLIYRNKKEAAASELKSGLSIVAKALGDSIDSLDAFEITIVPPIRPKTKK
jgi:hypothetical protein